VSILAGTDITNPEAIAETLTKVVEAHANIPVLRQQVQAGIQKVNQIGSYLDELMNQPFDSMERAQKLRQLIVDCRNYGG
jgi:hypothetical protein